MPRSPAREASSGPVHDSELTHHACIRSGTASRTAGHVSPTGGDAKARVGVVLAAIFAAGVVAGTVLVGATAATVDALRPDPAPAPTVTATATVTAPPAPAPTVTATTTATVTAPPAPARTPAPFPDGSWIVGTDIGAGMYRATPATVCVWVHSSGTATRNGKAGLGDRVTVTLTAGDMFRTSGCGTWSPAQ